MRDGGDVDEQVIGDGQGTSDQGTRGPGWRSERVCAQTIKDGWMHSSRSSLLGRVGEERVPKLQTPCKLLTCGLAQAQDSGEGKKTNSELSPTSSKQLADRVAEAHRGFRPPTEPLFAEPSPSKLPSSRA